MKTFMIALIIILGLTELQGQSIDPEREWKFIPKSQQEIIMYAYKWGLKKGYREMGAHYAVESRGDMKAIRYESKIDPTHICAGPGQNNVRFAAMDTFGEHITIEQFDLTLKRLQTDLDYSLTQSYRHVKIGLVLYKYRWNVWKWYNNSNAKSEIYPVRVEAWLKFLDEIYSNEGIEEKSKGE